MRLTGPKYMTLFVKPYRKVLTMSTKGDQNENKFQKKISSIDTAFHRGCRKTQHTYIFRGDRF